MAVENIVGFAEFVAMFDLVVGNYEKTGLVHLDVFGSRPQPY